MKDETAEPEPEAAGPERAAAGWIQAAAVILSIYFGYQLLLILGGLARGMLAIILLLVFGALLGYLLTPAVDTMERYGAPRTVGILLIYVIAGVSLAVAAALLLEPTSRQAAAVVQQFPAYVDVAQHWLQGVDDTLARLGLSLNVSNDFAQRARGVLTGGGLESALGAAVKWVRTAIESLVYVIIVLVIAFWIAKDGRNMRESMVQNLPVRLRDRAIFVLDAAGLVMGGYLRAQLVLALIIGSLAATGTWLLGVHFPLVIGLAAFVFELVPMVGPLAGGAVGVTIALFQAPRLALLTAAWFIVIHILEGYILAPRVTGKFVRLHPLVAFIALLTGLQVGGFLGALFAVPIASLGNVILTAIYRDYRAREPSEFSGKAPARSWRSLLRPFAAGGPGLRERLKGLVARPGMRQRLFLAIGGAGVALVLAFVGSRVLR
jgi:predicted PurR-regulated permease PerM